MNTAGKLSGLLLVLIIATALVVRRWLMAGVVRGGIDTMQLVKGTGMVWLAVGGKA